MEKNPYSVIKSRYVTEKSTMLAALEKAESNACLRKCKTPKVVFLVDRDANKQEIKKAVETIYTKRNIKVVSVNTILVKPKVRKLRGKIGKTNTYKKAIVSLRKGDSLEEQV